LDPVDTPADLDIDVLQSEIPQESEGAIVKEAEGSTQQTKGKRTERKKWTETEIEEINMYFHDFLETKTCPSKKDCMKAIEKSKIKGGPLANRFWHTIVKKISNLNKKA
jgi:hypothetical protein